MDMSHDVWALAAVAAKANAQPAVNAMTFPIFMIVSSPVAIGRLFLKFGYTNCIRFINF
jgi:hypothetical protein